MDRGRKAQCPHSTSENRIKIITPVSKGFLSSTHSKLRQIEINRIETDDRYFIPFVFNVRIEDQLVVSLLFQIQLFMPPGIHQVLDVNYHVVTGQTRHKHLLQ